MSHLLHAQLNGDGSQPSDQCLEQIASVTQTAQSDVGGEDRKMVNMYNDARLVAVREFCAENGGEHTAAAIFDLTANMMNKGYDGCSSVVDFTTVAGKLVLRAQKTWILFLNCSDGTVDGSVAGLWRQFDLMRGSFDLGLLENIFMECFKVLQERGLTCRNTNDFYDKKGSEYPGQLCMTYCYSAGTHARTHGQV